MKCIEFGISKKDLHWQAEPESKVPSGHPHTVPPESREKYVEHIVQLEDPEHSSQFGMEEEHANKKDITRLS